MATLNIRGISPEGAARIKRAAQVRGITLGEYLDRLSQLHQSMLANWTSDATEPHGMFVFAMLEPLGLSRIQE